MALFLWIWQWLSPVCLFIGGFYLVESGDSERIEFIGHVAPAHIRDWFMGKMIPEKYRVKGLASPFLYKKLVDGEETGRIDIPVAAKPTASAAAELSVTGNKKIGTLMKEFNKKFPYLRLLICYSYARQAVAKGESISGIDVDKTLASVRTNYLLILLTQLSLVAISSL